MREIRRSDGRVIVSSEWLSDATPPDIRRLVDDLDPARVHVVATLRPLAGMLPSQWQQFVQAGVTIPYETWLRTVFDEPESGTGRRFWHRHRHDRLLERWAAVVGPERVTALVVDDRDHNAVLRDFERLVGLTLGTLELVPDRTNRSLTRPEAELVRVLNGRLGDVGLDGPRRLDLVLFGAAANLKDREPAPGEPRIATPSWALERAGAVAEDIVAGIRASGVRVVGDLGRLAGTAAAGRAATREREAPRPVLEHVWPQIAAISSFGVLTAGGLARSGRGADAVAAFSTQRVRSILLGRLRDAAGAS